MRIAVIVLHFRHWPGIQATLDSLLGQGVGPAEVTIVDNASGDGSLEQVKAHYPGMRYVERKVNGGYAAGMNEGIRSCTTSPDAVLLVTHDCVLDGGALGVLRDRLAAAERVGAVGPMLAWRSRPERVFSGGGSLSGRSSIPDHIWWEDLVEQHLDAAPCEVAWLDGACLLLRLEAYRSVDGFDEGYFLYFEEVDFLVRMRKAGWRVECVPQALAWQEPATQLPPALWVRNRLRFLWRNAPRSAVARQLLVDLRDTSRSAISRDPRRRETAALKLRGLVAPIVRTSPEQLHQLSARTGAVSGEGRSDG